MNPAPQQPARSRRWIAIAGIAIFAVALYSTIAPAPQPAQPAPARAGATADPIDARAPEDRTAGASATRLSGAPNASATAASGARPAGSTAAPSTPPGLVPAPGRPPAADAAAVRAMPPMAAPDERAEAVLTVNGQPHPVRQNQHGIFVPRARVDAGAVVPFDVHYPDAEPGAKVFAAVMDGGALDGGQRSKLARLDDNKRARFTFTAGAEAGLYQISVRQGIEEKRVQIWVGPPVPLAQAAGARR